MISEAQIRLDLCALLTEELERAEGDITPGHRIDEIGADSIVLLAVFSELQVRYGMRANVRVLARKVRGRAIVTIEDLATVIRDFLEGRLDDTPVADDAI